MVLTVSFVLSLVTGLFCHHRQRKISSANLTPASGRQDHTTSPSASSALVRSTIRVHRIPHPTSVTIAKRPSFERGMAEEIKVIWVKREAENFFGEDWTGEISLKLQENFFST